MIPKDKALRLIQIYTHVCEQYEKTLFFHCQRYSNNSKPRFSDQEILTIYLFVGSEQRYTQLKAIHAFASDYLRDWFPNIVSYQTFVYRLNRMAGAVRVLLEQLIGAHRPAGLDQDTLIVDSMPIMTCCGRNRHAKVARSIADKGFCSTKNQYYYGLKLHCAGHRVKGHLPFPHLISISPASENDLTVYKQDMALNVSQKNVFADKIYQDEGFWKQEATRGNTLFSPVKAVKGTAAPLRHWDKAADDLYSATVSSIREPIESLFAWLIERTNIQRANRCRSAAGLLLHTYGKLAIAFIYLIFNC